MPRSLKAASAANQKPKTTGSPAQITPSSQLGVASRRGLRGGGVKGSADAYKR